MICMLQYDSLKNPVQPNSKKAANMAAQAQNYLEQHAYSEFDEQEIEKVCNGFLFVTIFVLQALYKLLFSTVEIFQAKNLLTEEMNVVKEGMAHGDLSLDAYTTVWEECLSQVMNTTSQFNYHECWRDWSEIIIFFSADFVLGNSKALYKSNSSG